MKETTLKDVAHASPFAPFVIHLSDGRSVDVPAPDFLSINPTGRTVVVWTPEGELRIISMGMITEFSIEQQTSP